MSLGRIPDTGSNVLQHGKETKCLPSPAASCGMKPSAASRRLESTGKLPTNPSATPAQQEPRFLCKARPSAPSLQKYGRVSAVAAQLRIRVTYAICHHMGGATRHNKHQHANSERCSSLSHCRLRLQINKMQPQTQPLDECHLAVYPTLEAMSSSTGKKPSACPLRLRLAA